MKKFLLILSLLSATLLSAACPKGHTPQYYKMWAKRFADSQMAHDPQLWMSDGVKQPKWDYTQVLLAKAMLQVYQATGEERYMEYVQEFADYFIAEDGSIKTYKLTDYNIDRVNGGSFLFIMHDLRPEERYMKACDLLFEQLKSHPRVKEGGYWHKKIYTHQMWLDGLYMAQPFYSRYAKEHVLEPSEVEAGDYKGTVDWGWNDIALHFRTVDSHTYDPKSGLNYHGWDESKEQRWADPNTGCSPHFWGRAMGWYVMAMVDVLENIPAEHPAHQEILKMLQRSAKNLLKYQDKKTHLWYQVLDMQKAEGNYQEATCSAIFCYAFAKAANRGYLPKSYMKEAEKIFDGLIRNKVTADGKGNYDLNGCCAVAGLGGNPYRDGTYDYYIHEPIRSNDPKGVGPMIFAALELAKNK